MAENGNGNGNGGPVDPPGGPPPSGPEVEITTEDIARAALDTNPKARAVAVSAIAAGQGVQVLFWRKDL